VVAGKSLNGRGPSFDPLALHPAGWHIGNREGDDEIGIVGASFEGFAVLTDQSNQGPYRQRSRSAARGQAAICPAENLKIRTEPVLKKIPDQDHANVASPSTGLSEARRLELGGAVSQPPSVCNLFKYFKASPEIIRFAVTARA